MEPPPKIISVKIDVTKLDRERFFKGKNGAKYADVTLIYSPGQFGDYMVKQDCTREEREGGVQMPIIGNGKIMGKKAAPVKRQAPPPRQRQPEPDPDLDPEDDIPF